MSNPENAETDPSSTTYLHWLSLLESTPPKIQVLLSDYANARAEQLAEAFYQVMTQDPDTRGLLELSLVNARLKKSLATWIQDLFGTWDASRLNQTIALQRHVGLIHARVNVGLHLVMRGARVLKQEASTHFNLLSADPDNRMAAWYSSLLIDLAIEEMSTAYVDANERAARAEEAYRVFASSANMSLERERQRSGLLEWESRFLHNILIAQTGDELPRLGSSSFGLWIQHKAAGIFPHSPELESITRSIHQVDGTLIPLATRELGNKQSEEMVRLLRAVNTELGQIRYLESSLFERLVDVEAGRDALTQVLNRRFLPGILSREIELCRRSGKCFSVLMIDVDWFKKVNDTYGHDSGDRVLQQLAGLLSNSVRSGDSVFRFGGEEFLVLAVELDAQRAIDLAEKLRTRISQEVFLLASGESMNISISIGVAVHDGHPDYQRMVDRADQALYRAKQNGRNTCVLAG